MATVARKSLRQDVAFEIRDADEHAAPSITVPVTACDHAGFRAWATSDDFPQRGRISFLDQAILIDMSPEELETHNKVKTTVTSGVYVITDKDESGTLYSDRTLVTNIQAGLSTEPDATFVSWATLRRGLVRLVPRLDFPGEYMEIEGSPDWVLEVISRSSWQKDTRTLRELYAQARIREYWLIDALSEQLQLQILQLRGTKYIAAPKHGDWQLSKVFGREFLLVRTRTKLGYWRYQLKSRAAV